MYTIDFVWLFATAFVLSVSGFGSLGELCFAVVWVFWLSCFAFV